MNITPKIETVALREILPFPSAWLPGLFTSAVSVCFAQPPSPIPDTQTQFQTSATELAEDEPAPTIRPEELESLVAPIALYPDPLLIQVLAASTYPLEIVQLKQWMDENRKLKDKGLAEAVVQRNWDPSVQGLAAFPGVVEKLANNIQWTTDLGNAFLAQEADVMDAVQGLRAKAQENGVLKANDKQTVSTETTDDGARPSRLSRHSARWFTFPRIIPRSFTGTRVLRAIQVILAIQRRLVTRAIQAHQATPMMVTLTWLCCRRGLRSGLRLLQLAGPLCRGELQQLLQQSLQSELEQ